MDVNNVDFKFFQNPSLEIFYEEENVYWALRIHTMCFWCVAVNINFLILFTKTKT